MEQNNVALFKSINPMMASDKCTCGDPKPYQPKGICAPMMPIDACMNCYPRGRPLTAEEEQFKADFLEHQLKLLEDAVTDDWINRINE